MCTNFTNWCASAFGSPLSENRFKNRALTCLSKWRPQTEIPPKTTGANSLCNHELYLCLSEDSGKKKKTKKHRSILEAYENVKDEDYHEVEDEEKQIKKKLNVNDKAQTRK